MSINDDLRRIEAGLLHPEVQVRADNLEDIIARDRANNTRTEEGMRRKRKFFAGDLLADMSRMSNSEIGRRVGLSRGAAKRFRRSLRKTANTDPISVVKMDKPLS
jgi:hypothetical protein